MEATMMDSENWRLFFAEFETLCSVNSRGTGVHDALKHVWSLSTRKVEIETDNVDVFRMLAHNATVPQENVIVEFVKAMLHPDRKVRSWLIRKDQNKVVEALTADSRGKPIDETIYDTPPSFVRDLLHVEQ
ncbi:hypothetical protein V6N12_028140 [Hibiscus sabdariffa]|uniref:RNase H type-1 domain-containing protein n=1 Tax=Hibiscus sabdariffa TaxID=183260 RepID=A0ABR2F4Y4_9ROSI